MQTTPDAGGGTTSGGRLNAIRSCGNIRNRPSQRKKTADMAVLCVLRLAQVGVTHRCIPNTCRSNLAELGLELRCGNLWFARRIVIGQLDVTEGTDDFQDFAACGKHPTTVALVLVQCSHELEFVLRVVALARRGIDLATSLALPSLSLPTVFLDRDVLLATIVSLLAT